jgi:hypothetical protein
VPSRFPLSGDLLFAEFAESDVARQGYLEPSPYPKGI